MASTEFQDETIQRSRVQRRFEATGRHFEILEKPWILWAIANYVPIVSETTGLDLGTGIGRGAELLAGLWLKPHNIVGIDKDPAALSIAREKHPESTFLQGDIAEIGVILSTARRENTQIPERFGIVIANMVLHQLDDDKVKAVLENCWNLMSAWSTLIIALPDPIRKRSARVDELGLRGKSRTIDVSVIGTSWPDRAPWRQTITYYHRDEAEYRVLLESSGFRPWHIDSFTPELTLREEIVFGSRDTTIVDCHPWNGMSNPRRLVIAATKPGRLVFGVGRTGTMGPKL